MTKNVVSGFKWNSLGLVSTQILSTLGVIILSRIIAPNIFGIIAVANIFTSLGSLAIGIGLKPIVIQTKNVNNEKLSTLFWIYTLIASLFYLIIFFTAPYIEILYGMPQLALGIRIVTFTLVLSAYNGIQDGLLSKRFDFKSLNLRLVSAQFFTLLLTIFIAIRYDEFIALACQSVISILISTVLLIRITKWIPSFKINISSLKEDFSFAKNIFLNSLLSLFTKKLDKVLIGKEYGDLQLGYYERASNFVQIPSKIILGLFSKTFTPYYASIRDDLTKVSKYYFLSYKVVSIILSILLIPIILEPKGFILIVFGPNWVAMTEYLRIFAISAYITGTNMLFGPILMAIGENKMMKREIFTKRIVSILLILISFPFGLIWMVYAKLLADIFNSIYTIFQLKEGIQLGVKTQIKELLSSHKLPVINIIILSGLVFFFSTLLTSIPLFVILFVLLVIITYLELVFLKPAYIQELVLHSSVDNRIKKFARLLFLVK